MPYVRPTDGRHISEREVALLGEILGLAIPQEDLGALAADLSAQLASIRELESLDLDRVAPVVLFDPSWPAPGRRS